MCFSHLRWLFESAFWAFMVSPSVIYYWSEGGIHWDAEQKPTHSNNFTPCLETIISWVDALHDFLLFKIPGFSLILTWRNRKPPVKCNKNLWQLFSGFVQTKWGSPAPDGGQNQNECNLLVFFAREDFTNRHEINTITLELNRSEWIVLNWAAYNWTLTFSGSFYSVLRHDSPQCNTTFHPILCPHKCF